MDILAKAQCITLFLFLLQYINCLNYYPRRRHHALASHLPLFDLISHEALDVFFVTSTIRVQIFPGTNNGVSLFSPLVVW